MAWYPENTLTAHQQKGTLPKKYFPKSPNALAHLRQAKIDLRSLTCWITLLALRLLCNMLWQQCLGVKGNHPQLEATRRKEWEGRQLTVYPGETTPLTQRINGTNNKKVWSYILDLYTGDKGTHLSGSIPIQRVLI